jgi:phage/plasmid-like protein (TIGR03299 family)
LDTWRVEAGLDWEAKRNALYYRDLEKVVRKSEREVLYRSDTGAELGIVSPSYQIVQPEEVVEFFRDLTSLHGFKMETAGSLDGGRKAWALAKTGGEFRLHGQDQVGAYVLLATSFDGTLATRAQFTSVRVVCNNTLQIGLRAGSGIAVSHSTGFDASKVKVELGLLESAFADFERNATVLTGRKVARKEAVQFLMDILADGESRTFTSCSRARVWARSLSRPMAQPGAL